MQFNFLKNKTKTIQRKKIVGLRKLQLSKLFFKNFLKITAFQPKVLNIFLNKNIQNIIFCLKNKTKIIVNLKKNQ